MARITVLLALLLGGCNGELGDRVSETGDPCLVLFTPAVTCTAAGKAAICHRPKPELLRRQTPECRGP